MFTATGGGKLSTTPRPAPPGAHRAGSQTPENACPPASQGTDARYRIQFGAGPQFMRQLEELHSLMSGRFPKGASLEEMFGTVHQGILEPAFAGPALQTETKAEIEPQNRYTQGKAFDGSEQSLPPCSEGDS